MDHREVTALVPTVSPAPSAADSAPEEFRRFASRASSIGREAADIAGKLEDLAAAGVRQQSGFNDLTAQTERMDQSNAQIEHSARQAREVASQARSAVQTSLDGTRVLAQAVDEVASGIGAVTQALRGVSEAAGRISSIAMQTRILAFNASVEAVHAGAAGRGFGVVAQAIKELSQQSQESSALISQTVAALGQRIDELSRKSRIEGNANSESSLSAVESAFSSFHAAFDAVQNEIGSMSAAAEQNIETCRAVSSGCAALVGDATQSQKHLEGALERVHDLLLLSEDLIEIAADCGMESEDTPYIEAVLEAAARVVSAFEEGIERGQITREDLWDASYRPIAGTKPEQFMTRYVQFTDRVLPAIQEPMLDLSPNVVFCAAVDRNGFLPTHNRKFSAPQGKDPVWNAANCRNRRLFTDRTGLGAAQNRKRFLLQTYRRDMGGGKFVLMKDLSAPLMVLGRHWGGLRLAYRFEDSGNGR